MHPPRKPQEPSGHYHAANEIGGRPFKVAYRRAGYTLAKLAKTIGVSMSYVEKWSRGTRKMPETRKKQIQRLLAKGPIDHVGMEVCPRARRTQKARNHVQANYGPCRGCSGDPTAYSNLVGEECCACHGTGMRPGPGPEVKGVRSFNMLVGEVGN